MDIDIVIPFVNGNDPQWINDYEKYKYGETTHLGDGNKNTRFDGYDILKYVFRTIDQYVPWVCKIHLLLHSESQIPYWLNRDKVHIVLHKDFIPEKHLPIFNSSAFEMYLWNIPDLSEYFLYMNDDIIFNSKVKPELYFNENKKPRIGIVKNKINNAELLNAAYLTTFMNSAKLASYGTDVNPFNYGYIYTTVHSINPYTKSILKHIYDMYTRQIENSITKFREEKNFNQYLYALYYCFRQINGEYIRKMKYMKVDNNIGNIEKFLKDKTIHEICVNDVPITQEMNKIELQNIFENYFPDKSKYEL